MRPRSSSSIRSRTRLREADRERFGLAPSREPKHQWENRVSLAGSLDDREPSGLLGIGDGGEGSRKPGLQAALSNRYRLFRYHDWFERSSLRLRRHAVVVVDQRCLGTVYARSYEKIEAGPTVASPSITRFRRRSYNAYTVDEADNYRLYNASGNDYLPP
jgi:hypothetical protein